MTTIATMAIRLQAPESPGNMQHLDERNAVAMDFCKEMYEHAREIFEMNPRMAELGICVKAWGDGCPRVDKV
jgi:hypothetical protein